MISMSVWVLIGLAFVIGVIVGVIFTDVCHMVFTRAAWHSVRCLADQSVELFKELKEAKAKRYPPWEPWEEEGEEWKLGGMND